MFETVPMAPPDAILGLTEAFGRDPNPHKINLGVGVYKDAQGKTPVLATVKTAERRILETQTSKNYMPIEGSPEYAAAVQALLFGADHEVVTGQRAVTAATPGGTGALRVAADYLQKQHRDATVWLSEPTWPNHPQIFQAAGLKTATYAYFNPAANGLDVDAMLAALQQVQPGDVVLLHGCCHNPTGADPTAQQWAAITDLLAQRGALPLLDFAYQGFAEGLKEDATALLTLARPGAELIVCSSFSKNFGLYNDRVGALTFVAADKEPAQAVLSQVKACIRANYSNPPAHGGLIVSTILNDPALRAQWEAEVAQMRNRINGMRSRFVQALAQRGVQRDFAFIQQQKGMFSFSGLTKEQVERLRQQYAIYIVGSGRINVAGMTDDNMDRLCDAIAAVLADKK